MSRADKRLQKMRRNPRDWRIEEIRSVADSLGIEWQHDGGSHVIFRSPYGEHLSIPAHQTYLYHEVLDLDRKQAGGRK